MTHIWTIKNELCTVSNFSLKSVIKSFLLHAETHDIKAGMFMLVEFKASHDQDRGAWEEKLEESVWIDPTEGFDDIYKALK